jgi:hypothetical protein
MGQEPCLGQLPIDRRDTSVLQGECAGADTSVGKIGVEQQIDIIDDSPKEWRRFGNTRTASATVTVACTWPALSAAMLSIGPFAAAPTRRILPLCLCLGLSFLIYIYNVFEVNNYNLDLCREGHPLPRTFVYPILLQTQND